MIYSLLLLSHESAVFFYTRLQQLRGNLRAPGGSIESPMDYVSGREKWENRAALYRILAI